MNNLRVYVVTDTFHPIVGGIEKHAFEHSRGLRERGYEATIITFRYDKSWSAYEEIEGVPVFRVAGVLLGNRKKLPRLLQKALYLMALVVMSGKLWQQRHSYDILHAYQLTLIALPTALTCWLTGKPMVAVLSCADAGRSTPIRNNAAQLADSLVPAVSELRVGGRVSCEGDLYGLERLGKPIVRFTHTLLLHINVGVIIISSYMKSYLADHKFMFPDTLLIPNGVDIEHFTPAYVDVPFVKRAHVVVCVARLAFQKGIDVLLHAWHLVQEQFPQARLIIVGTGPLRSQLEDLAQELGLTESVEFAGVQHDMPMQFKRAEVSILPSRWEGMPIALLEAMACGLACVATRVSGSEDIITSGVDGLLVEPEDYQDMAQALLTLLRDSDLAQKYGRAARRTVEQRYAFEHTTDCYINFYHKVVEQRRHRTI